MRKNKRFIIEGKEITLVQFAIYIGVSRQQIYNYLKEYKVNEIIKYKKRNNMSLDEVLQKHRRNLPKEKKKEVNIIEEKNKKIEDLQLKIKRSINIIDNLIKNYYKGDYCLQDLIEIKKELI